MNRKGADYTRSPMTLNIVAKSLNLLSNVAAKVEVSKQSLNYELTPYSLGLSKKVQSLSSMNIFKMDDQTLMKLRVETGAINALLSELEASGTYISVSKILREVPLLQKFSQLLTTTLVTEMG